MPTVRNSKDLNIACVTRCKYAREGSPNLKVSIINEICLIVDSATIFLMSYSTVAQILEVSSVAVLLRRRRLFSRPTEEIKG